MRPRSVISSPPLMNTAAISIPSRSTSTRRECISRFSTRRQNRSFMPSPAVIVSLGQRQHHIRAGAPAAANRAPARGSALTGKPVSKRVPVLRAVNALPSQSAVPKTTGKSQFHASQPQQRHVQVHAIGYGIQTRHPGVCRPVIAASAVSVRRLNSVAVETVCTPPPIASRRGRNRRIQSAARPQPRRGQQPR